MSLEKTLFHHIWAKKILQAVITVEHFKKQFKFPAKIFPFFSEALYDLVICFDFMENLLNSGDIGLQMNTIFSFFNRLSGIMKNYFILIDNTYL